MATKQATPHHVPREVLPEPLFKQKHQKASGLWQSSSAG